VAETLTSVHDQAAAAAIGWLEGEIAYASRGHAREFSIETTGLIIAAFRHRTAREEKDVDRAGVPDPHCTRTS
jgi:hypothetical protein